MATRKTLKKVIDEISFEIIADCYAFLQLRENKAEDIMNILNNMVNARNIAFEGISQYKKLSEGTDSKKYFRGLQINFEGVVNESVLKLEVIAKESK